MKHVCLLFRRSPCSERLINQELEAAGFCTSTRHRQNFDKTRKCTVTVGATVLGPKEAAPMFRAAEGAVFVTVSAITGDLAMSDLDLVQAVVMHHFSKPDPEEEMFAAKMAAIKCLGERKSRQKKGPRKKLTKAQLDELRRLYREPQNTYGSARARVQNNLVLAGLAQFSLDGVLHPPREAFSPLGYNVIADQCVITAAGRSLVESGGGLGSTK